MNRREWARQQYIITGDEDYLHIMNKEENKPDKVAKRLEYFVIGMVLVTMASPFIQYLYYVMRGWL